MTWKLLFFVAACCVTAGGVIGFFGFISDLNIFALLDDIYLIIFGCMMLVVDFPIKQRNLQIFKLAIYGNFLFMTRFTGRGIWYLFLGCMTFGTLYDNGFSQFLGIFLGGYIVVVGIIAIVYGVTLSNKLEKVRTQIRNHRDQIHIPEQGLTGQQFNAQVSRICGDTYSFSPEEINFVLNALSFSPDADDVLKIDEFDEWMTGRMTPL